MKSLHESRKEHQFNLRNEARRLGDLILNAHPDFDITALGSGVSINELENIVKTRQMQLTAMQLGVPIEAGEKARTVRSRILEALPDVIAEKGLRVGSVVVKNFGGQATDPHEVLDFFYESDTVELRHLASESIYGYSAILLARHATPYTEPTS